MRAERGEVAADARAVQAGDGIVVGVAGGGARGGGRGGKARCAGVGVRMVVEEGDAVAVRLLVDAQRAAVDDVVAGARDDARALLRALSCVQLHRLVERRRDRPHARALGQRRELDDRRERRTCRPRLVRQHDAVHQLLRPGVLDLQRLLVLERLGREPAQDADGQRGLQVAVRDAQPEPRPHRRRPQLVLDRRAPERRRGDGRRERPADLQLEREQVAPGLEGVCVGAVALEERPLVVAHQVRELRRAERQPVSVPARRPVSVRP